jgi:hypothetical protein
MLVVRPCGEAAQILPRDGRFCRARCEKRDANPPGRFSGRAAKLSVSLAADGYDWPGVCGSNFSAKPFMQ